MQTHDGKEWLTREECMVLLKRKMPEHSWSLLNSKIVSKILIKSHAKNDLTHRQVSVRHFAKNEVIEFIKNYREKVKIRNIKPSQSDLISFRDTYIKLNMTRAMLKDRLKYLGLDIIKEKRHIYFKIKQVEKIAKELEQYNNKYIDFFCAALYLRIPNVTLEYWCKIGRYNLSCTKHFNGKRVIERSVLETARFPILERERFLEEMKTLKNKYLPTREQHKKIHLLWQTMTKSQCGHEIFKARLELEELKKYVPKLVKQKGEEVYSENFNFNPKDLFMY